jgi:tetratricopeptide (TPR) repeat protein
MFCKLLLSLLALAADGADSSAKPDAPKYQAGSRVIVIHETPLRVDDYPVKQLEPGTPLRVEEVNDQGFLGVTSGRAGWVDAADVVSVENAIEPLTQLLEHDTDNIRLHQTRAVIAAAQKNYDVAIEDLTTLMRLEPDATKYYLLRGDAYLAKHDKEKALADLDEAVRRDEDPGFALLKRGFLYSGQKEFDKALDDFNAALSHDLDDAARAQVLAYRGSVYFDQHEYDKAFADFDEALKLNPQDSLNFVMRGSANAGRGKYKEAIADYSAALWIDADASTYAHRGYAFLRNGELAAAKNDFEKAIKLDPENTYALIGRGRLLAEKKEFDKALADFNTCVQLEPKDAEPLVARADIYGQMKQYDKQIADYREAIRVAPDDSTAHNNLAWILATCPEEKYRGGKEAVDQADKAVELTKNKQGEFIDTLAAAYAEAGDFDKAAENQQKAIDMESDEKQRKDMQARLEMFRKHEAYRETPGENPAAG